MRLIFLALLLTALGSQVIGQAAGGPKGKKSSSGISISDTRREKLRTAGYLLEQTLSDTDNWADRKLAVESVADAADLLWSINEPLSRKSLLRAWQTTFELRSERKETNSQVMFFSDQLPNEMRAKLLLVAKKHDEKLVETFLKDLKDDSDADTEKGVFDNKSKKSDQLLRLASLVVKDDPGYASRLAELSLADGISQGIQYVLIEVRKKDQRIANLLFEKVLSKFASDGPDVGEAQTIAGYLFSTGRTFGVAPNGQVVLIANPEQVNINPVAISEPRQATSFLVITYRKFLSEQFQLNEVEKSNVVVLCSQILPYYSRYAPDLAAPAFSAFARLKGQPNDLSQSEDKQAADKGADKYATPEQIYEERLAKLLSKAENETDPIAKDMAFAKAAVFTKEKDFSRGLKIARSIGDDVTRFDVENFIQYRFGIFSLRQGNRMDAEETLVALKDLKKRAMLGMAIASRIQKDSKFKSLQTAYQSPDGLRMIGFIYDVEKDIGKVPPDDDRISLLFALSSLWNEFDASKALSVFEGAVQEANGIDGLRLKSLGVPRIGVSFDPAMGLSLPSPELSFGIRSLLKGFDDKNFSAVSSIVDRLATRENRGIARIELARIAIDRSSLSNP